MIHAEAVTLWASNDRSANVVIRSDRFYEIPIYQRPYNWGENEVRRLFQTLIHNFRIRQTSFLGTLLCLPKGSDDDKRLKYEVVDGQQRLTTILLFLKYLHLLKSRADRATLYPSAEAAPPWVGALGEFDWPELPETSWLTSRVNKGGEGNDLQATLKHETWAWAKTNQEDGGRNRYETSLRTIAIAFEDLWDDVEEGSDLTNAACFSDFIQYLGSQVQVVVIKAETGLTQALAIFDTINTTGMALDTSDLFKVRVYDYLSRLDGNNKGDFDAIDELYTLIKTKNAGLHSNVRMNMQEVLDWYRHVLIAKHGLPLALHDYGNERFWDDFFRRTLMHESVLNMDNIPTLKQNHEGDKQVASEFARIHLADLRRLIIAKARLDEGDYPYKPTAFRSMKQYYMVRLLFFTRYGGRYWWLVEMYTYRFMPEGEDDLQEALAREAAFAQKLEEFTTLVTRCFAILSLAYLKVVYEGHSLAHRIATQVMKADARPETVLEFLKKEYQVLAYEPRFGGESYHTRITRHLSEDIFGWPSYCRLILMLALLSKENLDQDQELHTKVFDSYDTGWDVEHIFPQTPTEDLDSEYIESLNGTTHRLGNLTFLPYDFNRSISNKPHKEKREAFFAKKETLPDIKLNSYFIEYEDWSSEAFESRQKDLSDGVMEFLFPSGVLGGQRRTNGS